MPKIGKKYLPDGLRCGYCHTPVVDGDDLCGHCGCELTTGHHISGVPMDELALTAAATKAANPN